MKRSLVNQELNFEGGPWKLRNGDTVQNLELDTFAEKPFYYSESDTKSGRTWDLKGNNFNTEFDIMESLMNWKYLRYHGYE